MVKLLRVRNLKWENDSIYGALEKGIWDVKGGTYTPDRGNDLSTMFNLSWFVIYPIKGIDSWISYLESRNGTSISNLNNSQTATIHAELYSDYYNETAVFNEYEKYFLYIDTKTGVVQYYYYESIEESGVNNGRYGFSTMTREMFDWYDIEPWYSNNVNQLFIGIIVTAVIIIFLFLLIRKRKGRQQ